MGLTEALTFITEGSRRSPGDGSARTDKCSKQRSSRPAGFLEMPGSEDPWPICGNRDRVLEMARKRPILGIDRPVVAADADAVLTGRGHRLDGQDHPLLQLRACARLAVVGD